MSKKWYKTPEVDVEVGQVRIIDAESISLIVAVFGRSIVYCLRDDGIVWGSATNIYLARKWPLHDDQDGERKRIRGE